ncbi:MAG: PKD domain-containing protein [Crocinitomicaceae bacterium]
MIFTKLLLTTLFLIPIRNVDKTNNKEIQQVNVKQFADEPNIDFTYSFSPAAGVTNFKGSTTISKNLIQKCRWNFGDNTQSEEHSPQHFYESPGVYNVTFTIILKTGEELNISKSISWLINN